jgi:hypothetical protein
MIEIRFDKTKDEVALLIWFLVDHSVHTYYYLAASLFFITVKITETITSTKLAQ